MAGCEYHPLPAPPPCLCLSQHSFSGVSVVTMELTRPATVGCANPGCGYCPCPLWSGKWVPLPARTRSLPGAPAPVLPLTAPGTGTDTASLGPHRTGQDVSLHIPAAPRCGLKHSGGCTHWRLSGCQSWGDGGGCARGETEACSLSTELGSASFPGWGFLPYHTQRLPPRNPLS